MTKPLTEQRRDEQGPIGLNRNGSTALPPAAKKPESQQGSDLAVDYLTLAIQLLRQDPARLASAELAEAALRLANPRATFGDQLRSRRKAARLSFPSLARKSGLSEHTLKNLEASKTQPAQGSLARLLAVPELKLAIAEHVQPPVPPPDDEANAYLTERYDPAGLANDLRAIVNGPGGTIEQSHLYLDSQSAADYLAVCDAYGGVRSRLITALEEIAIRLAQDAGELEVVAIGSGDGRAEVGLAHELAERHAISKLLLLDVSHVLLARARQHAASVLRPLGVPVKAVHGNFHELLRYSMLHGGPGKPRRLYTLLGATLANLADELRFFRDLASCASPGDLALLDYQTAFDPPEQDPAFRIGSVPKILVDWQAGPLRRNNPDVREVSVELKLAPGRLPGSYIAVFVATATMTDGSTRIYRLLQGSRYQPALLSEALKGTGWETVSTKAYDDRTAVSLLRRI